MINVRAEYRFDNNKIKGAIEEKIKGLPKYVSEYMYNNIDEVLNRTRQNVVDYIYDPKWGVKRGTGKLGRAVITSKQRINQYAFKAGVYFDYVFARHLASIINDKKELVIKAEDTGRKYLTVPDGRNNPTGKNPARVFGLEFNPMINRKTKESLGTPFWYKGRVYNAGKGIKRRYDYPNILFWGKKEVTHHPRIRFAEIQEVVDKSIDSDVVKKLTEKAVANFKASRGSYKSFNYSGFGG